MYKEPFGYPDECNLCNKLGHACKLRVKSYYKQGNSHRIMLIGQDPTVRKNPDRVKHALMLNNPKSQLFKWLNGLLGEVNFKNATIYGTNIVKCTFPIPPTDQDDRDFLSPFFQNCKNYLIQEVANYKPDLVLTFGEITHQSFIDLLDFHDAINNDMKMAFNGQFYVAEMQSHQFRYSPCLHLQTFRVAEKYGDKVKVIKETINSYFNS